MNYSGLYHFDVLNGLGFRVSLFISGCDRKPKCRDCQNPKAWRHDYGEVFTEATKQEIKKTLAHKSIRGISLLGGEPSDNLLDGVLLDFLAEIQQEFPSKDVWAWSGYQIEDLLANPLKRQFLNFVDVLIDGEFIPELKNLNRPFGNSTNQRIIDVPKTLASGQIVPFEWK